MTELKNKKSEKRLIVVAGGAGFLGSHLCDSLIQSQSSSFSIYVVDNFYTGSRDNLLMHAAAVKVFEADITSPTFVTDFCVYLEKNETCQFAGIELYNLACPASPVHYQKDPVFTWKTSVLGTLHLLELTTCFPRRRFLQASTSEVYGEPLMHPQCETHFAHLNTLGPRSCYDVGKAAAETLVQDYAAQHHIHASIARIFNVYGPRMSPVDGRIISNFCTQALHNLPLTIYGTGQQTRSFCYVQDLIGGLVTLMNHDKPLVVNLGNPTEMTVLEVAEKIRTHKRLSTVPPPLVFNAARIDDPTRRKPDISLAQQVLHWQPLVSFDVGLDATMAYFSGIN